MKIQQEKNTYRPITIKLETREEAQTFFELVTLLMDSSTISSKQRELVTYLCEGDGPLDF